MTKNQQISLMIAAAFKANGGDIVKAFDTVMGEGAYAKLAGEVARVELVVALHTLASHYENALYAFGEDAEALRKAKGDIAHAMKIAAKHNKNGTGCE